MNKGESLKALQSTNLWQKTSSARQRKGPQQTGKRRDKKPLFPVRIKGLCKELKKRDKQFSINQILVDV